MNDIFTIYLDRLKEGKTETIHQEISSDFLEINEKELQFTKTLTMQSKASLVDGHLIIYLHAAAQALMPCAVCNKMTLYPLLIENAIVTVPIEKISDAVYNFKHDLREAILLEIPINTECAGNCPERKHLKKYLEKEKIQHYPFKNLSKEKER